MSIAEEQPRVVINRPRAWPAAWTAFRFSSTIVTRPLAVMGRPLLSSPGNGIRGYRREGYLEIELYQILAGREDKFDGL